MLHCVLEEHNLHGYLKSYLPQADNPYVNRYPHLNPAHVLVWNQAWMTAEETLIIRQWSYSLQSTTNVVFISTQGWQVIKQCHPIHGHRRE